jgi:hypothetical protein
MLDWLFLLRREGDSSPSESQNEAGVNIPTFEGIGDLPEYIL